MPSIIEAKRIGALSVASFDEDGWSPRPLTEISLPVFSLPERQKQQATEWDSFANIREAVRDAEEGEWLKKKTAAKDQYRRNLHEALAALESLTALPEPARQSKRTDIVGLLKRISEIQSQNPQFVIVLTDLADTQYRELPHIAAPQIETHVLVLLIPAERQDALLTIGKPLSGPEQFHLRVRQLRESAPWIVVAPYFTRNLAKHLS